MNFDQQLNKNKTINYTAIAQEISDMVEQDQKMRKKITDFFKNTGKKQISFEESGMRMEDIDIPNTQKMKEIVSEIGWPTISKVGVKGAKNAWLLVQHADLSPNFQKQCLALMEEAKDGVDRWQIAYLTDRVLLAENKPQKFGSQWWRSPDSGEWEPINLENTVVADKLRIEYGMKTLEEYRKIVIAQNE